MNEERRIGENDMIKVNWSKIKPFERKNFAILVMAVLVLIAIVAFIFCFISPVINVWIKFATAVLVFIDVAFFIHIESRMLQIYFLMAVLDIGLIFTVSVPLKRTLDIIFLVIAALIFLVAIALTIVSNFVCKDKTKYNFPEVKRENIFANKNVMFFAPHEDDEINVYGGVIEQYVKNHSTIRVVFSTNGDFHGLGKMRIREALNVAKSYGIPEENFIFLGYSDSLSNKQGKHLYNCAPDEIVKSKFGFTETYGNKSKKPYKTHEFTRNNFLNDVKNVIETYKPDVLYCCDYDLHVDHRAISLIFEEALDEILKTSPLYHPEVYKGFAYSTAWDGLDDYYSQNMISTRLKHPSSYMRETNVYAWKDRVRFPVDIDCLSRVMQNSSSYIAMSEYSSQTATDHANSILNGDKVFWHRRTDNVLLEAKIIASSGDASNVNNFKLVDSDNIKDKNALPLKGIWITDRGDKEKTILFKLPSKRKIVSLVLYDNPSEYGHIVNANVKIGTFSFNTGELKENGVATIFEFNPVMTDEISIKILNYNGSCSLLRVEAYETYEDDRVEFIKICNGDDDFCYDYIINKNGREQFSIYTYPECRNLKYYVSSDSDGLKAECDGSYINVVCPPGEEGILTVTLADNPDIFDKIRIQNPDERERSIISYKQKLEHAIYSPELQWDYYRGLLRRLGTYFPFLNR